MTSNRTGGRTTAQPPKKPSVPAQPKPAYTPTPAEVEQVRAHAERRRSRPPAPRVRLRHRPPEPARIEPDHPDPAVWAAALHEALGTAETAFADRLLGQLVTALDRHKDAPLDPDTVNAALAALHGIRPRDELEGMLAAQMVATHAAALDLLGRTTRAEYLKQIQAHGGLALKLLRTFALQLEALQRYRGKGQQRVTVEHVHVHAGGQAVVGAVSAGPGGPGASPQTEERAHAQQPQQRRLGHAPEPEVRRADAERAPVPVAGGER